MVSLFKKVKFCDSHYLKCLYGVLLYVQMCEEKFLRKQLVKGMYFLNDSISYYSSKEIKAVNITLCVYVYIMYLYM